MPAVKTTTVKAALLVLDTSIYPRHDLDDDHVRDLAEALKAGSVLPPIVVEPSSMRIVDGAHRQRAALRAFGEDAEVEVLSLVYADDAAIFEDAMRRNAGHGRKLSKYDIARCHIRAQELGIDDDRAAAALHLTLETLSGLTERKTATVDGNIVAIKATGQHLHGEEITKSQYEGIRRSSGLQPRYYVNQVINLLEHDLIDWDNVGLVEALHRLHDAVEKALREHHVTPAA